MVERMRQFWDKSGVSICMTLSLLLCICLGWMVHSIFVSGQLVQMADTASSERLFIANQYQANLDRLQTRLDERTEEVRRLTDIVAKAGNDAGKAAVSAANAAEAAAKSGSTPQP